MQEAALMRDQYPEMEMEHRLVVVSWCSGVKVDGREERYVWMQKLLLIVQQVADFIRKKGIESYTSKEDQWVPEWNKKTLWSS